MVKDKVKFTEQDKEYFEITEEFMEFQTPSAYKARHDKLMLEAIAQEIQRILID